MNTPGADGGPIGDQHVTYEQSVFHRSGCDDESLQQKRPEEKEKHYRDENGLDPFDHCIGLGLNRVQFVTGSRHSGPSPSLFCLVLRRIEGIDSTYL